MQYSDEFIILAPPFERNFQITWQNYIVRKVDSEDKTP